MANYLDDDDSLRVEVFADGDDTTCADIIVRTQETSDEHPFTFDYDDQDSVHHPCITTNEDIIRDGQYIKSHNGRWFRIDIKELLPDESGAGLCVDCGAQCVSGGEGSVLCPVCDKPEGDENASE